MKEFDGNFDTNNIHSVELNLLDGQVEIILRALELYGYNLDYMLNFRWHKTRKACFIKIYLWTSISNASRANWKQE